jgi:hypothetical protein
MFDGSHRTNKREINLAGASASSKSSARITSRWRDGSARPGPRLRRTCSAVGGGGCRRGVGEEVASMLPPTKDDDDDAMMPRESNEDDGNGLNMCIKRYGVSAVRKWHGTNHEDDLLTSVYANMYRQMAELNSKPHCPIEGSQLLGNAASSEGLSCWVSLVDRSNDETA